jgi:dTDP-4-amino-4,6-dideoxygalactose transaminase
MTVEFFRHNLGDEALLSVKKVLNGLFLTAGPMTRQFEEAFSGYLDCTHELHHGAVFVPQGA